MKINSLSFCPGGVYFFFSSSSSSCGIIFGHSVHFFLSNLSLLTLDLMLVVLLLHLTSDVTSRLTSFLTLLPSRSCRCLFVHGYFHVFLLSRVHLPSRLPTWITTEGSLTPAYSTWELICPPIFNNNVVGFSLVLDIAPEVILPPISLFRYSFEPMRLASNRSLISLERRLEMRFFSSSRHSAIAVIFSSHHLLQQPRRRVIPFHTPSRISSS